MLSYVTLVAWIYLKKMKSSPLKVSVEVCVQTLLLTLPYQPFLIWIVFSRCGLTRKGTSINKHLLLQRSLILRFASQPLFVASPHLPLKFKQRSFGEGITTEGTSKKISVYYSRDENRSVSLRLKIVEVSHVSWLRLAMFLF